MTTSDPFKIIMFYILLDAEAAVELGSPMFDGLAITREELIRYLSEDDFTRVDDFVAHARENTPNVDYIMFDTESEMNEYFRENAIALGTTSFILSSVSNQDAIEKLPLDK